MGTTAADRQRRYRAHRSGDHGLCDPDRSCRRGTETPPAPVTDVPPSVTAVTPAGLGPRGALLWAELSAAGSSPGRRALAEEACRITDRLDKLERLLEGTASDWIDIIEARGDDDRLMVVVDKPLAEARQHALALKAIITELRQSGSVQVAEGGDPIDELARARLTRQARTAAGS